MSTMVPIDSIVIGDRVRKDMGDLKGLAESMKTRGLMHPVVLKADRTLVAGQRRIEAARLLAWKEISASILSIEDLFAAELDENGQRKDFTRTEAVAIGRLIEDEERPKALARMAQGRPPRTSERITEDISPGGPRQQVREVVGAAVGMSGITYQRAKAVVIAAEVEPEKFADLPERMDRGESVERLYREMKGRSEGAEGTSTKGRTAPRSSSSQRHPLNKNRHHPKLSRIVLAAVASLEGICAALEGVDETLLVSLPEDAPRWATAIEVSLSQIRKFARRLKA